MKTTKRIGATSLGVIVLALASLTLLGSGWDPEKESLRKETAAVDRAIAAFRHDNPRLEIYFQEAYGWAVFPTIGTGGAVVSGAYGTGQVYEKGKLVGRTETKKAGLGLTIGGGSYSEILFFRDKEALDRFTNGDVKFEAGAKVVAIKGGAATATSWNEGVAVFLRSKKGLMADASVAGQAFTFEPLSTATAAK
jgi:lipid-binding SYLF domain-containing protein